MFHYQILKPGQLHWHFILIRMCSEWSRRRRNRGTRKIRHKKKQTRDPQSHSDSLTRHQHRPKERGLSHLLSKRQKDRKDKGGGRKYIILSRPGAVSAQRHFSKTVPVVQFTWAWGAHMKVLPQLYLFQQNASHIKEKTLAEGKTAWAKTPLKHSVCCLWAFKNLQKTHFYTQ